MCDFFWQRMDTDTNTTTTTTNTNNNADQGGGAVGGGGGGDLADIVWMVNASSAAPPPQSSTSWQLPENMPSTSFQQQQQQQQLMTDNNYVDGDSFDARDPLLHELTGTAFFECESAGEKEALDKTGTATSRPCNNLLFSRVLHISPAAATATAFSSKAPPPPLPIKSSLPIIVPGDSGLQISSPTTPGIKRRKNQAKKVVCIPAPASASSRPSGEVVPSDLWAWRKYGQKPIKGSPYPRGYYRCSSSKGCSARKQVERSRTDPNMLVITYTSEHNHPWPTQRNALAGSTRSQPSKIGALATSKKTPPPPPPIIQEPNKEPMSTTSPTNVGASTVKKEEEMTITTTTDDDHIFNQVFYNENPVSGDDFFAELAELDSDPMSLVFPRSPTTGIIGESVSRSGEEVVKEKEKLETSSGSKGGGLESFINMFDWGGMSSFGIGEINQPKKGL